MNAKKIIKGIMGIGIVGGIAYLAYKVGESCGESKERIEEKYGDDEDGGFDYDEPDDGCIAPANGRKMPDIKKHIPFDGECAGVGVGYAEAFTIAASA